MLNLRVHNWKMNKASSLKRDARNVGSGKRHFLGTLNNTTARGNRKWKRIGHCATRNQRPHVMDSRAWPRNHHV